MIDVTKPSPEMISVTVGQLPGGIKPIKVAAPATVSSVLTAAGLKSDGWEIRVNNAVATLDTPVSNGNFVVLVQPVKGN